MTTQFNEGSPGADSPSGVGDELKEDAGRLRHTIEDRAKQEAETRKGQAANVLGSASAALGNAADELERNADAPDWLASAVKQAAGKIDAMAGQIEGRNIDEIGRTVASFARQNPGAFLAASAAAGFAAARVLRAGIDKSHEHHDGGSSGNQGGGEPTGGVWNDRAATGGVTSPGSAGMTGGVTSPGGAGMTGGVGTTGGAGGTGGLAGTIERDIGGVAP